MDDIKYIIVLIVIIVLCGGILAYRVYNPKEIDYNTIDTTVSTLEEDNIEDTSIDDDTNEDSTAEDSTVEDGTPESEFNEKFTVYEGTGKKSANLSSMINKVTMSNGGSENKVLIEFDGKLYEEAEINNIVDLLSATDTYEVKCEYDSATNLVNKIVVTKVVEEE